MTGKTRASVIDGLDQVSPHGQYAAALFFGSYRQRYSRIMPPPLRDKVLKGAGRNLIIC